MKCLVIAGDRVLYPTLRRSVGDDVDLHVWLEKGERTPYSDLTKVFRGDPTTLECYSGFAPGEAYVAVIFQRPRSRAERIAKALQAKLPRSRILFLALDEDRPPVDALAGARVALWDDLVRRPLAEEVRALVTSWQVEEVRGLLAGAQRVGLLIQSDPDPDALASALALRTLLGRNRVSAPIVSFGAGVTRPENREMSKLLNLPVEQLQDGDLDGYDRLVCLDIQPPVLGDRLAGREVDAVIDHHPPGASYRAAYRDVRVSYGATSTILTEYLVAAAEPIHQRLATALLYGIKTDTLFLDRVRSEADVHAFNLLYPIANLNLLRRIDRPEVPAGALRAFGRALQRLKVEGGLSFAFLGEVGEDVIAQMADLLMQVEGAQWAAAVGIVGDAVIGSVRNAGFQRAAGEVVRKVFGEVGSAGGHRNMAKLVVPVAAFKERFGGISRAHVGEVFYGPFLAALNGEPPEAQEGQGTREAEEE